MSIILERPDVVETSRKLRATLVARAADLVPLLRTNATTTEDERRVPEENIAAIERAGLFRLTQPKRFGGFEADFRTKLEVISELARGCGSTAWVTSLMTGGAWFIGVGAGPQPDKPPAKGLYPSQTGFGWTNAIFERFCQEYIDKK